MSSEQSRTPVPAPLTLVFDQKLTTPHLDEQCPHRTTAEKAGQPGYSKEATKFRKAMADELKALRLVQVLPGARAQSRRRGAGGREVQARADRAP